MLQQFQLWLVSSYIGLGAIRAGINLGQVNIFDYYREALGEIWNSGLSGYVGRVSRPYLVKAITHMDPQRDTHTERALRKVRLPQINLPLPSRTRRSGG